MPSDHDGSFDAVRESRCPECSASLFEIIPQQTTWRAIEEFLQSADFDGADIANLVPTDLKKQLLRHALEHSDRENSGDAMSAFGDVVD